MKARITLERVEILLLEELCLRVQVAEDPTLDRVKNSRHFARLCDCVAKAKERTKPAR